MLIEIDSDVYRKKAKTKFMLAGEAIRGKVYSLPDGGKAEYLVHGIKEYRDYCFFYTGKEVRGIREHSVIREVIV